MKKGFTLIELVVVLVILAIIFVISIPIVLKIIDKSQLKIGRQNVDNYGRAIELAMSEYRLEKGVYSYDINELNVKYSGEKVDCEDIILNENGTVYLSKCKIGEDYIEDDKGNYYTYGVIKNDYTVGDKVNYKGMTFYVIRNNRKNEKYVTLIKGEPLKSSEVREFASATEIYNELNLSNEYLYMRYLYREDCSSLDNVVTGCDSDYSVSSVKQIVDTWANYNLNMDDLAYDDLGYKVRLVSMTDVLRDNIFHKTVGVSSDCYVSNNSDILNAFPDMSSIFTMTTYDDSNEYVWNLSATAAFYTHVSSEYRIRPVINLKKSVIEG